MSLRYTLFAALAICFISLPAQTVRYVATYGSSFGGSSWGNPSNDLQAMINASSPGDEVWVRTGTYTPSRDPDGSTSPADPRDKTFYLKDGVKVYGGFAGNESTRAQRSATGNETILSGEIGIAWDIADNCYHVVLSVADGATTVLDRFTITGGNADGVGDIVVETYNLLRDCGGGMQNHASSPSIENCIFTSNTSTHRGGGIYNNAASNPTLTQVTISSNTGTYGGGMFCEGSSPVMTNCTLSNNVGTLNGGGMFNQGGSTPMLTNCVFSQNSATTFTGVSNANSSGGGMFNEGASPTLIGCSFTSNRARNNGGGIYNNNNSNAILTNCTISGNTTNNPTYVDYGIVNIGIGGAGVFNRLSSPTFTNCAFIGNNTHASGGGIRSGSGVPVLVNCVFWGNYARQYGGGLIIFDSAPTLTNCHVVSNGAGISGAGLYLSNAAATPLTNCIVWANGGGGTTGIAGGSTVTYSIVQGGYTGTGNTSTAPVFLNDADPDGADNLWGTADDGLQPGAGSVAINGGDPATTTPTTDIAGSARTGTFDIGAYESNYCRILSQNGRVYVTPTGTGDGSSWTTATNNLQAAIDNTCGVTEIWVAAGTYKPAAYPTGCTDCATTRDYAFALKEGVSVYGGFAGNETALSQRNIATNASILSGDIGTTNDNTDNCHHVVVAAFANTTPTTRLDGFTITGGYASGTTGGITVNGQSLYRSYGGGICAYAGANTLANNTFSANSAGTAAGAIYIEAGANTLTNNILSGNSAPYGGGIYTYSGTNTLINNTFSANAAAVSGGGVYTYLGTNTLINNTLSANTAANSGGGIFSYDGTNTLTNNVLWGNKQGGSPTVQGADYYADGTNGNTLKNNILQLAGGNYPATTATPYGIGTAATGNLFAQDPLFANAADIDGADNLHRTADDGLVPGNTSPAINAGNPAVTNPLTDITGNLRVGTFDIGSYEDISPCRLYVDAAVATSGAGTSWATAVKTIEEGLSLVCKTGEVWTKSGTYTPIKDPFGNTNPTDPREKTFYLRDGIKLYGGFAGTETALNQRDIAANVTTLSGDIGTAADNTDNCYHVIISVADAANTVLDGFTISGGNANSGGQIVVEGASLDRGLAGGAFLDGASFGIANCTFTDNFGYYGGAMYNNNCQLTFSQTVFTGNTAGVNSGGVNSFYGTATFTRCAFANNTAGHVAGAMGNFNSTITINQCVFSGNQSASATLGGGALFNSGGQVSLDHCTITGNTATNWGGAILSRNSAVVNLSHCILWNNVATASGLPVEDTNGSTTTMTWSTAEGGYAGTGNISSNPQFVNAADPNGTDNRWMTTDDGQALSNASPAINAGDPAAGPGTDITGATYSGRPDMGAYENTDPCLGITTRMYASATGTGLGASWADAIDLQAAINNTCGATEIWVKAGTYLPAKDHTGNASPADPRNKTFMLKNGIQVYGGFAGTETALSQRNVAENQTVLSGDLGTAGNIVDNSYHILISVSDGNTTTLDGFTISGGYCNGGGTLTIEGKPVYQFRGGGMYNVSSAINIANCIFTNNQTSTDRGGAMNCEDGSMPKIDNCVFSSNIAGFGGAIFCENSSPEIRNSLFSGNTASYGGAMFNFISGNPTINNCTFANNVSNVNGQVFYIDAGAISTLNNSILWGNTGAGAPVVGPCTIANSLVQGGYTGTNVLDSNPLFVNAADPDGADNLWLTADDGLRLACGSSAINTGTNTGVTATTDATGAPRTRFTTTDMGAYESLMATLTAPQPVAAASLTRTADAECTDQSGWTHYYASATNDVLLSVQKNGNDIGTVGDGTFAVTSNTTPNWGSNTGTTISAPYVDNPQWFIMNRWWNVTATHQPASDVSVRTYYTAQDLADVNGSLGSNAITAAQMRFYKINGGNASLTATQPHAGIGIASAYHASGYWDYIPGPVASTTQWAMGTNPDGATYAEYVIASFSGGGGGGGAGGTGAFPVEWLDFTATQTQVNGSLAANLQWITGMEANVAAFEIERSIGEPGVAWVNIGTAQPSNTSGPHAYTFTDTELGALAVATVYYRIRSVDADGSVSHSNIATLAVQSGMQLEVYPNPVQHQLSIQLFASSPTSTQPQFILYDPTGRIISEKHLQYTLNQIDTQGLSQGLYPWRIIADGKVYTGTVVKE